jgi:hypothetical protein
VELCSLVLKNKVASHWTCENTGTREKSKRLLDYVLIGVPKETWAAGQSYRSDVENAVIINCKR